jgi:hypothetical protein
MDTHSHVYLQAGLLDDTDEETYYPEEDYNDNVGMDCYQCGVRIDTIEDLGVHCDLCEIYYHTSCAGQCRCESIPVTGSADDEDVYLDLTMMDEDEEREEGQ